MAPRGRCTLRSCHAGPIFHGCIRSSPSVAGVLEVREAESPSGYGWGLWDRGGLGRRVLPGRCLQRLTPPNSASAGEGVSVLGVRGGFLSFSTAVSLSFEPRERALFFFFSYFARLLFLLTTLSSVPAPVRCHLRNLKLGFSTGIFLRRRLDSFYYWEEFPHFPQSTFQIWTHTIPNVHTPQFPLGAWEFLATPRE